MDIEVIFTGGTIGSGYKKEGIGLTKEGAASVVSCKKTTCAGERITYQVHMPFTILSENSTGETIGTLAKLLCDRLEHTQGDGIIITHGTDTLAYTAAALGYLAGQITKPVVLVSSNYVLQDARANGWDNFRYGVEFISWCRQQTQPVGGVFVSYKNTGDVPRIHKGTALLAHQSYTDDIESIQNQFYGYFDEQAIFHCNAIEEKGASQIWCANLMPPKHWDSGIQQIIPYPGMRYPKLATDTKAVLHHTYHAGTICSESPDVKSFFEAAKDRGIPVFLCGADPDMVYESTTIYETYGIHVLPVAAPIAMYVKLWLLLENDKDPVLWMKRRLYGE